ncbi:MAG: thioredoxin-disulfide reductase [Dehalococcoidia bacterium]|nr:thioredoxin-disulfide reductase [Dehalococcoidia bacterium]
MTNHEAVDVAIIGGGGAGLTAAIYAARARRRTVVYEKAVTGGQIGTTDRVDNYPGFPDGVNGFELAERMRRQAEHFGAEMRYVEVNAVLPQPDGTFEIETAEGTDTARAVIATGGADYNHLNVPGETEFTGKGVSYCATCDGAFFKDQEVAVVGGGDAAIDEALFLTRYASRVHVIHRRDELRAGAILQEKAFASPTIDFTWDTTVEAIEGHAEVEHLRLRNVKTGREEPMEVAAVFIFIGQTPNSHLLRGLVDMDEGGHAIVDLEMRSSRPGLFVAGDLRSLAARQLISAAGDGATAAITAERYLNHLGG